MEYIDDLESSNNHDNMCDVHFKFHQPFVLTESFIFIKKDYSSTLVSFTKKSYNFNLSPHFLKPPIV